jgi:hypothetical protein
LEIAVKLEHSENLTWQTRYGLLLWFSELLLVPFALVTFGSDTSERLYKLTRRYLGIPGKERDAAAVAMARFASRADTSQTYTCRIFEEVADNWDSSSIFMKLGSLQVTALMLQLSSPLAILQK